MKKTKKLIHNGKIILSEMKFATNLFDISRGLMFRRKKIIEKGICLVIPTKKETRINASITMFFCFSSMDILFLNKNFEVVDKVELKPWIFNYTPEKPAKYVIESISHKFKGIKIGDKVKVTD